MARQPLHSQDGIRMEQSGKVREFDIDLGNFGILGKVREIVVCL